MSWTISVNPIRCRGHGICVLMFSEALELDAWGYGRAVEEEFHDRKNLARARRAARACPNGAITVRADGDPTGSNLYFG